MHCASGAATSNHNILEWNKCCVRAFCCHAQQCVRCLEVTDSERDLTRRLILVDGLDWNRSNYWRKRKLGSSNFDLHTVVETPISEFPNVVPVDDRCVSHFDFSFECSQGKTVVIRVLILSPRADEGIFKSFECEELADPMFLGMSNEQLKDVNRRSVSFAIIRIPI